MTDKNKKKTLFDLILTVPIVVIALVLFFISKNNTSNGTYACVIIDGQVVGRYSLEKDGDYPLNNGSNTLSIRNGYAMIIDADCPDKTCEKQGKINLQGQKIVCLPNKLMVAVEGEKGGVDIVL